MLKDILKRAYKKGEGTKQASKHKTWVPPVPNNKKKENQQIVL